jgi:hypothetical protein
MKRTVVSITVVFAALALLVAAQAVAQPGVKWRGSGGWGHGGPYGRMYDPKNVERISGEVVGVERFTPRKGMSAGVHVTVKTDKETVSVHLGPAWYLENQDVKLEPMDRVEVRGARVTVGGKPAIIAADVRKGDEVLTLRDERGVPAWSGWRRR